MTEAVSFRFGCPMKTNALWVKREANSGIEDFQGYWGLNPSECTCGEYERFEKKLLEDLQESSGIPYKEISPK